MESDIEGGAAMSSGGSRPGSGRKSVNQDKKKVQMTITIKPETREMIQELRGRGIKIGSLFDELIRQYFEDGK